MCLVVFLVARRNAPADAWTETPVRPRKNSWALPLIEDRPEYRCYLGCFSVVVGSRWKIHCRRREQHSSFLGGRTQMQVKLSDGEQ